MARTYATAKGTATAFRREYGWMVQAESGDQIIRVDCYRDEAGFAGRDWRVDADPAQHGIGRLGDTLDGRDQFSGLKDVAETAIAVCARTAELERLREEWNRPRDPRSLTPWERQHHVGRGLR